MENTNNNIDETKNENKIKNMIISFGFVVLVFTVFITNLVIRDKTVSEYERRALQNFPKITLETVSSGDAMNKFEKYTTDQFAFRDTFRSIKALFNLNVYRQKDNNKLFEKDGSIYKMDYPLNNSNLNKSLDKIVNVYNKYIKGKNMTTYYAIIPDKNYYLESDDHLKIDYNKLKATAKNKLNGLTYIDIWNDLQLNDYYRTDLHWKQENLSNVVNTLEKSMKLKSTKHITYNIENRGDFYGTYYGQLATNVTPDTLYTLTNDTIYNATVYNYESKKTGPVYTNETSQDRYDTFLYGATPLIRIDNPNAKENKELLLFRDSFSSSLAPLLIENYSSITLIDLRYISSNLLDQYIDFNNQDVLFIYSTLILNQNVLK